ncbi:MAG: hypothetical protein ACR65O_14275 [Methylomicrobium sp.]
MKLTNRLRQPTPTVSGDGRKTFSKVFATARKHRKSLAVLWLLLAAPAAAWSQSATIVSAPAGACTLSLEADEEWHALRLRAHHPRSQPCDIDQETVLSLLAAAFAKTDPPALRGGYASLFIGRLIDYPWLSHHLAETARRDKRWNGKKGRPIKMEINAYVARLLFNRDLLKPIQAELGKHGYRIAGVSVEKVLVGGASDLPGLAGKNLSGRIPFDAQVWFRLQKN